MKFFLTALLGLLAFATPAAAEFSTPKDWDINAAFPQPTKVESSAEKTGIGPIKQTTVSSQEGEESYVVVQITFPGVVSENQHDMLYESGKRNVLRAGKGVLTKDDKAAVANLAGRRWLVNFPAENHRGEFRVILIGQTLYLAGYEAPAATYSDKRAKLFFKSIKQRDPKSDHADDSGENRRLSPNSKIVVHRGSALAHKPVEKKLAPAQWSLEVAFSGTLKEVSADYPSPVGPILQTTRAQTEGDVIYGITRVTFPVMIPDEQIDTMVEHTKRNLLDRGSLKLEEIVTVAGQLGRRYVVEYTRDYAFDDYRTDYRLLMLDQSIYIVFYRAPMNSYSAADGRHFFNSIRRTLR